jgi:hypothetical protein
MERSAFITIYETVLGGGTIRKNCDEQLTIIDRVLALVVLIYP